MRNQLRDMNLSWIISGKKVAPRSYSTEPVDVLVYRKWRCKGDCTSTEIQNAIKPHIWGQYASNIYYTNPKAIWDKLTEGYRKARGWELYYFRQSVMDTTLEVHGTGAKYVYDINRITECLREADQVIKLEEKAFYLLYVLPPSWREWHELQGSIINPDKPNKLVTAIKTREASLNQDHVASNDVVLAGQCKRLAAPCTYGSARSLIKSTIKQD